MKNQKKRFVILSNNTILEMNEDLSRENEIYYHSHTSYEDILLLAAKQDNTLYWDIKTNKITGNDYTNINEKEIELPKRLKEIYSTGILRLCEDGNSKC
jgi:hypothetical protein